MSQVTVKLTKGHVRVPAVIHYDLDPPDSDSGYSGWLEVEKIEMDHPDAMVLLTELINDRIETRLHGAWDGDYLDELMEVEL